MNKLQLISLLAAPWLTVGCASSKISSLPTEGELTHPVKTILIGAEGGLLGEALDIELSKLGYTIISADATSKLLLRLNINEMEAVTAPGLEALREQGIDVYLIVKGDGIYDGQVKNADARALSTETGLIIAEVIWQNAWGGMSSSMADRMMRKDVDEAAQEISGTLARSLPMK